MKNKIIVYSTEKDLKLKSNIIVYPIDFLGNKKTDWINEVAEFMATVKPSKLEELFLDKIKGFAYSITRQPYFRINGAGYFLDFFVPSLNLAIEIDGKKNHYSKKKEIKDWRRDKAFQSIGIKTVRFTAVEIKKDNFRDTIFTQKVLDLLSCKTTINDNYHRPKCERFNGRESINRMLIRGAIEIIERCREREKVIIESDYTYILNVLNHGKNASTKSANKDLLDTYYSKRNEKQVKTGLRFCGNRDNMKKSGLEWATNLDSICRDLFDGARVINLSYSASGKKPIIKGV